MNKVLTLCDRCKDLMAENFRVKPLSTSTTELKTACENCKKRVSKYALNRYLVQSKGGK